MTTTIDERELVRQAYSLEPLPASTARLARLVSAEDPDLDEILETVSFDPFLTAQLLTYANSVALGARHPVDTVRMAVIRLGIGTALSLCVASCMQSRMDHALPEYDLAKGELWRHSVVAALAAECVANEAHTPVSPASFTAALLHDIGKLVIAGNLSDDAATHMRRMLEAGRSRLEAEVELFGIHHGALGRLLAEHWGLPEVIASGIGLHHTPSADTSMTADVVHVSNCVAKGISPDSSTDDDGLLYFIEPLIEPESLERLAIDSPVGLADIVDKARTRVAEVLSHFD